MKIASYFRVGFHTTLNIILYAATKWEFLWLEGRVYRGVYRNWARDLRYRPAKFERPSSEPEISQLVANSEKVRVFGAGHSFNKGNRSGELLISLDNYKGRVPDDLPENQITVKAGTRLREVVRLLAENCLAFEALPSHDAQSIAGILSTDVHGTGVGTSSGPEPAQGFISESVVRLKLLDSNGEIKVCHPDEDLFKAAIGGLGAVGIILEVTLKAVPRFNIDQKVEIYDLADVRENLDKLIECNDHFSLYLFPFADKCQVNTWNKTKRPHSPNAAIREFVNISSDALLSAWLGNFLAYTGMLRLSRYWFRVAYLIRRGTNLILESDCAFNRTIYHLHQEFEFTIPYAKTWEVYDELVKLYENNYSSRPPYTLFEMRFTPARHERTLIGPGRERRCTWIDIVTNDSDGFQKYYTDAAKIIRKVDGRPHLGKYCEGFDVEYLQGLYKEHFETFQRLIAKQDPKGKFSNAFTEGLFGRNADLADTFATIPS